MDIITKEVNHAFGKDVYLLGVKGGQRIWIEAPKWDCGWYWGFGYITTYTNDKNPSKARDLDSSSHWDSGITGKHEVYNSDKGCFVQGDYIHHLNEHSGVTASVLTDKESWLLAEYMKSFYTLRATAELYHRGSSNLTTCDNEQKLLKDAGLAEMINQQQLPALFKLIIALLSPETN